MERGAAKAVLWLMDSQIHKSPSDVTAEEGVVMIDGPDGVAVSLSPDAAAETSHRLLLGAAEAAGQQVAARKKREGAQPV
jgi:hypothetical protein